MEPSLDDGRGTGLRRQELGDRAVARLPLEVEDAVGVASRWHSGLMGRLGRGQPVTQAVRLRHVHGRVVDRERTRTVRVGRPSGSRGCRGSGRVAPRGRIMRR